MEHENSFREQNIFFSNNWLLIEFLSCTLQRLFVCFWAHKSLLTRLKCCLHQKHIRATRTNDFFSCTLHSMQLPTTLWKSWVAPKFHIRSTRRSLDAWRGRIFLLFLANIDCILCRHINFMSQPNNFKCCGGYWVTFQLPHTSLSCRSSKKLILIEIEIESEFMSLTEIEINFQLQHWNEIFSSFRRILKPTSPLLEFEFQCSLTELIT